MEIEKAKEFYLEWLEKNGASNLDDSPPKNKSKEFDYYIDIRANIGKLSLECCFYIFSGNPQPFIDYYDGKTWYVDKSIDEFLSLLN
jgi:hypothetical protein